MLLCFPGIQAEISVSWLFAGIGKTTCALMACKELGLQFVEMNASDARNKKFLESKVAELIGCHQIDEYFGGKSRKGRR